MEGFDVTASRNRNDHSGSCQAATGRAAQMPDWYGDHKFMILRARPFHRLFARLPLMPAMRNLQTSRTFVRLFRPLAIGLLALQFAAAPFSAALAQKVPIVRDAEIEALVRDYATPILKAAGLSGSGINIVLVNDSGFNAFVAGRRMFINTGALMTAETPNEIIGVIAHEAGHLAGGHQERLRNQLARAQTMAVVAALLGIGATVAGAAGDVPGLAQAGGGIAIGGGEMARRGLLGYQRAEETTADRSALSYLERTGQSAKGMLTTFRRFQNGLALSGSRIDPYLVSHPMPRDRIAALEPLAKASPHFNKTDPAALQTRHDLVRAKIAAYMQGQGAVARLFRSNPGGAATLYGDAIVTYLYGNPGAAIGKADALVKAQPGNPYLHELRGDILMKANRPAEAAEAYAQAIRLDPAKSGLLQVAYGQALMATGRPDAISKAVSELKKGLDRDRENASGYRHLAQAYGQLGQIGEAELATAEGHYYSGNYQDAKIFAARAQTKMKRGSPGWVRAQDIISSKQPGKK
jgi:predicted Zn-dependent protease